MKEKGLQGSRMKKNSLRHTYYLTTNQDECSCYYKKCTYDTRPIHYQYIVDRYPCSKENPRKLEKIQRL
jgi:hypothetical protein